MKWAGWVVAVILLAVLLWPKGPAPVDNSAALRAQNDSLRTAIEGRDMRQQLMNEAADSLRQRLDSFVNNAPTPEVRYLRWHGTVRAWSVDSLWRYLGTMPADTGAARYVAPLGSGKGNN